MDISICLAVPRKGELCSGQSRDVFRCGKVGVVDLLYRVAILSGLALCAIDQNETCILDVITTMESKRA